MTNVEDMEIGRDETMRCDDVKRSILQRLWVVKERDELFYLELDGRLLV